MNENILRVLEFTLKFLPLLVGAFALIALVVAIRGVLIARKLAYEAKHKDLQALKERVHRELNKN